MTKRLYLCFLVMLLPLLSFSQQMTISGHIQDTTNNQNVPLPNALAMLVRIKDSVLVDYKRSDENGFFEFKTPIDTLQLIVSHPRFSENSYYIFGSAGSHEFDIKRIIIPQKSQNLKEVVIYAYKDPVYYKGDTLVYVADSFQTKPNAVVEDLLKKLPGIKVNADGSIEAQGKEIQQVLVDGDEFFGADPTMATRNLGAQGVETVEIYEKKDENSTDDSETIQVLDLRLKDDAKKGYFGKISGATDAGLTNGKPFYEGEFLANKFNKTQKISVFALGSNTMRSSLEWRDMYKYGLTSRNFFDEENENWSWNFSNNQGDGIPTTLKTGIYYNDQISKKTELNINYTYNNAGIRTLETNRSQYFLEDTSYVTDLKSRSEDKNVSNDLNFKFTHKLDSVSTLELETAAGLNTAETNATDSTDFLFEDLQLSRRTVVSNINKAKGTNLTSKLSYRRDFKKKGRRMTSFYRFAYDDNKSDGILTVDDPTLFTPTNQSKDNSSLSRSHTASASYIEPLGKKFKLEFNYEFYNNFNEQEKYTRNFANGSYSEIDSTYSNNFQTTKTQHLAGTQLIFEHKKHRISGGVRYRNVVIDNENLFFGTHIHQDITNYLPRARYVYKISQHNRFMLNYNTSSSQPSINQLQPVRDNTNPNRLIVGNPNLKPNYVHNFSGSFNTYKPLSGVYFWSSVNHTITNNAFANSTTYDALGRSTSQTINVDGNTSSSLNFGTGFPVFKKFLEVVPNVNMSRSRQVNFVDSVQNVTINQNIGGGLELKIERDSVEFTVGGDFAYTKPSSTISFQSILPYYSQSYSASFLWKLPKGFFIETDADYTINSQRAAGYDLDFLIWNASVSKSFLKNENLIATLHVYDILNQNVSANRYVNANVITDTKSVIIARYFMARLTFKFNSTKTKEPDDFF
ncbi:MAG: hypothetical protein K0R65_1227 [Crocinitomicaceae bacterium]|nr:hypothetical protein [Crocinitomicaceae bacterium]